MPEVDSTSIGGIETTNHNGIVFITTGNGQNGPLWPKDEQTRPILHSCACLAVATNRQLKIEYTSHVDGGWLGCEVLKII